jgi:K+-transporting ATPase ATPase C chain
MLRRQLTTALLTTLALTVLLGLIFPLAVWALGQTAFRNQADGSFVSANGKVVGSSLIGQSFTDKDGNPDLRYFQPRPSAAGNGYDAMASSSSNLGPSNPKLVGDCNPVPKKDAAGNAVVDAKGNPVNETNADGTPVCDPNSVPQRVLAYRAAYHLGANDPVPVDAVTASGSGLDPGISVANALIQARTVATRRRLTVGDVTALVLSHTTDRQFGFLGEKAVNVLELNLALDQAAQAR